ncbi:penicillin-binding protein [Vagococcus penaei]|uniref:Penicillin-binding protein n=1 Tax=Vagococcus penaei TaxID=633807 RepID=A0A1Q2D6W5_9ENTE|nr:PBP1A family penicillin-binding protein [Vagococcus penaei]AQP54041.1 penicillin-binding protein [Vagococcus penaei]RSU01726.1 penicillin-binding protein [Vagococcus penaei]
MDVKKILTVCREKLAQGWTWFKPHWIRFRKWRKRIWKKFYINKILLLLALSITLISSIYLFYLAKTANIDTLKTGLEQVTTIYDRDNEKAGTLAVYGAKGSFVQIDQISPYIKDAVVSTEDRRFYEHHGYDVKGIARAAVRGVINRNASGGGGSTITQQLAKNAKLSADQTLTRKARELFLAIEIEKKYSKDEILEMYLNKAYFGNGVWGVQDASRKYFGKDAKDVTIDEAAVLAGMLKGPSIYNPIDHMDNAIARRDTVLSVMVDNGKLDEATAKQLMSEPLYVNDNYQPDHGSYRYPSYFDAVIDEAVRVTKLTDDEISNGGYKIFTSLDQQYQQGMDQTFANDSLFPQNAKDGAIVEGTSIAVDPKTGGVMGVIAGREYQYRGFNRALNSNLSPGSTMKPLSVYTSALEAGYQPEDILKDEALDYYDVQNYSRTYSGEVPMYDALAQSLNAPAVWLLHEMGIDRGYKKAEQFGIKLDEKDRYYGLALGGLTKGTTPLAMASAYSVFANEGVRQDPHFITRIEDPTGAIIYENAKSKSTRVTTPEVAESMTSMLQGVFSSGTGIEANPSGFTIAGKTGTTENINADGMSKDQWIIGYTPDVVVATWIGFDKSGKDHYLTGSSSSLLSGIFKDEMERILAASPNTPFSVADVSQQNSESSSDESTDWDGLGNKVKDSANNFGNGVKEGVNKVTDGIKQGVDRVGDVLDNFWGRFSQ